MVGSKPATLNKNLLNKSRCFVALNWLPFSINCPQIFSITFRFCRIWRCHWIVRDSGGWENFRRFKNITILFYQLLVLGKKFVCSKNTSIANRMRVSCRYECVWMSIVLWFIFFFIFMVSPSSAFRTPRYRPLPPQICSIWFTRQLQKI